MNARYVAERLATKLMSEGTFVSKREFIRQALLEMGLPGAFSGLEWLIAFDAASNPQTVAKAIAKHGHQAWKHICADLEPAAYDRSMRLSMLEVDGADMPNIASATPIEIMTHAMNAAHASYKHKNVCVSPSWEIYHFEYAFECYSNFYIAPTSTHTRYYKEIREYADWTISKGTLPSEHRFISECLALCNLPERLSLSIALAHDWFIGMRPVIDDIACRWKRLTLSIHAIHPTDRNTVMVLNLPDAEMPNEATASFVELVEFSMKQMVAAHPWIATEVPNWNADALKETVSCYREYVAPTMKKNAAVKELLNAATLKAGNAKELQQAELKLARIQEILVANAKITNAGHGNELWMCVNEVFNGPRAIEPVKEKAILIDAFELSESESDDSGSDSDYEAKSESDYESESSDDDEFSGDEREWNSDDE